MTNVFVLFLFFGTFITVKNVRVKLFPGVGGGVGGQRGVGRVEAREWGCIRGWVG